MTVNHARMISTVDPEECRRRKLCFVEADSNALDSQHLTLVKVGEPCPHIPQQIRVAPYAQLEITAQVQNKDHNNVMLVLTSQIWDL